MRWLLLLLITLFSALANATLYSNAINDGGWSVNSSIFECRLAHQVPFYGDAVFLKRAGEDSQFFLKPLSERLKTGKASLVSLPPVWKYDAEKVDLGYVAVMRGERPVKLNSRYAERLLTELLDGMELEITRQPWYGGKESSRVAITPIGFRSAYKDYQDCLAGLLPVNFDQIKRTSVFFGSAKFEDLLPKDRKKLDNIVLYAKADPNVTEFFIDGHTDAVGMRNDNLSLSEKRAKTVTDYLVSRGLSKEKITMRWHGERYPVISNKTRAGRAKNRRVTIRLERLEELPSN